MENRRKSPVATTDFDPGHRPPRGEGDRKELTGRTILGSRQEFLFF
jgi:hypothetical protein